MRGACVCVKTLGRDIGPREMSYVFTVCVCVCCAHVWVVVGGSWGVCGLGNLLGSLQAEGRT